MFSKLVLLVCTLVALFSGASAFAPSRAARSNMAMKLSGPKINVNIPAAVLPFVVPAAAIAAEGTGRAFGFDDSRLIWAALAPSFIIFPLYLKWASQQDDGDFFDGYEKRRSG